MQNANKTSVSEIQRLLSIMAQLRDANTGCPWDVKQTMESLTRYTIEEAYEVVDAIAGGDIDDIRDELGDLLFQVVFYAQIAKEAGEFNFDDVAKSISDKMVRRHPHVFNPQVNTFAEGDSSLSESAKDELLNKQWNAIKAEEKRAKTAEHGTSQSILDNVPSGIPALMYAQKLQKACAKVGFDWADVAPVIDKVREEIDEVKQEIDIQHATPSTNNQQAIEEEIGDALFAMVNLARHCNVDADTALRKASHKFSVRFKGVEKQAKAQGTSLESLTLDEMEVMWQQVKSEESLL